MDTWGFLLMGLGALLYFVVKDKRWGCSVGFFGLGIVVAAVWAVVIVNRIIP